VVLKTLELKIIRVIVPLSFIGAWSEHLGEAGIVKRMIFIRVGVLIVALWRLQTVRKVFRVVSLASSCCTAQV